MKESIINVLALFGAITVLISIGFLIFMTVVTWKEHVKEEKCRRKRAYEIAHRFERKPLARCHCVDCRYSQGVRFENNDFKRKMVKCDLWGQHMVTYDDSFCYRADPRK